MRFHIGFSKHITMKTLFKIGLAFLGLIGISSCSAVHAETGSTQYFDFSNASSLLTVEGNYITRSDGTNNQYYNAPSYQSNASTSWDTAMPRKNILYYSQTAGNSSAVLINNANGYYYVSVNNPAGLTAFVNEYTFYHFPRTSLNCSNDDYKSVDVTLNVQFLYTDNHSYGMAQSNFNNMGELYTVKISAWDSNHVAYPTTCTYVSTTNIGSQYPLVTYTCSNVFIGDSTHEIDTLSFDMINNTPFDATLHHSGSAYNSRYQILNSYWFDLSRTSYTCDTVESPNGPVTPPIDPPALDEFYQDVQENFENNPTGFTLDYITVPEHISELMSLPIFVVSQIVANSSSCEPYDLDLSGLMSFTGNSHYTLTLPCMRSTLSDLLGSLYTLADVLLAAIVFYNVAMAVIQLLDAITSGVDLYSYYFRRSSRSDGAHINHATGEVK